MAQTGGARRARGAQHSRGRRIVRRRVRPHAWDAPTVARPRCEAGDEPARLRWPGARPDPDGLLDDLDPEQREAVLATSGPVASSPARAPARPGSSRSARRTRSRRATWPPSTCSSSRSPTRPPARWSSGSRRSACRGHRPDVPRRRAQPAPPLLAVAPRRRACPASSTRRSRSSADLAAAAARPLPVHAARRTSPTRSSGRRRGGSARRAYEARSGASAGREPPLPVDLFAPLFGATSARRRGPAGSTSRTCSSRPSGCSRTTPTPPRPSAPGSAGSASTSTRTRARSSSGCSSCGSADRDGPCVVGDVDQTIYTFTGASSRC